MSSYIERVEENLKQKIHILEQAYESDVRFMQNTDVDNGSLEQYDEYLEEQDSYLSTLEDLDAEYDRIYEYLAANKEILTRADQSVKDRLNSLISEVNGKLQAVRDAESKVREITENYFKNRKNRIAISRKNTRVIQNNYGTIPSLASADNSMIYVSN